MTIWPLNSFQIFIEIFREFKDIDVCEENVRKIMKYLEKEYTSGKLEKTDNRKNIIRTGDLFGKRGRTEPKQEERNGRKNFNSPKSHDKFAKTSQTPNQIATSSNVPQPSNTQAKEKTKFYTNKNQNGGNRFKKE